MTVVPEVPLGTVKVQLKAPELPVVIEPLVQLEITTLSNTNDFSAVETENPVPLTVTDVPGFPDLGLTVIFGVVTLNVALACWPPTSVTVTVLPAVLLGTEMVQVNLPPEFVVSPPPTEQLEIVTLSKTSVAVLVTEKPVPVTVTVAPVGPCFGLRVIFGVVTLNVAVAVDPPTSVATTELPLVPVGTEKVQLKAPDPLVVSEPLEQGATISTPSNVSPTGLETENPLPFTVTVAPTGPCFGLVEIETAVTVKDPLAD